MPSINNSTSGSILPKVRRFVEIKQFWESNWKVVQYLIPLQSKDVVAPEVPVASFQYDIGRIKRENKFSYSQYNPRNIRDYFIRIIIQRTGDNPVVAWTGIVASDNVIYDRGNIASGEQVITAYGFAHLLDSKQISNAKVWEQFTLKSISWVPNFNERKKKGIALKGNRSLLTRSDEDNYVFERNGEAWTNRQILDYLLEQFGPPNVDFELVGQTGPLDDIEDVHRLEGLTLWGALKTLIDRKRGLGFFFWTSSERQQQDTKPVKIVVYTITDFPITFGSINIPANANQVQFNLPTQFPFNHMVEDVNLGSTSENTYDIIEVLGERIKVMGTFGHDDFLQGGWNILGSLNQDYKDANGINADEKENDMYRSATKFDDIYITHKVIKNWDWTVWDGQNGGRHTNKESVAPKVKDDGSVEFDDETSDFWNSHKSFERTLPMQSGIDYTVSPPVDNNPDDAEPDFVKFMVMIKDDTEGDVHSKSDKYHFVDKLHDSNKALNNISVTLLDNELGFRLGATPKHYLALNNWNANGPTQVEPELDYEKLICTGFIKTDHKLKVVVRFTDRDVRIRTIQISGAEYWYSPNDQTVIGIDTDGDLIYNAVSVFRDDSDTLRSVAALAYIWYGKTRQAVEIPIKQLGRYVELGSLLTKINTAFSNESVRTVVTSRELDYRNDRTVIKTGYFDLDFQTLAG